MCQRPSKQLLGNQAFSFLVLLERSLLFPSLFQTPGLAWAMSPAHGDQSCAAPGAAGLGGAPPFGT